MSSVTSSHSRQSSHRGETESKPVADVEIPIRVKEFAKAREMDVFQINSQRIFGPSLFVREDWEPEQGCEVFIGKIPRDFLEPELVPFLEQVGPIYQLRLMMDFSGSNKGYCFAQYFSIQQAELAVATFNKKKILDRNRIFVTKSVDNRRLVLSGVPTSKSEEEILEALELLTEGIVKIDATWTFQDPAFEKGIVFVTYDKHRLAALARKKLLSQPLLIWDCAINVEWAEPESGTSPFLHKEHVLLLQKVHPRTSLKELWRTFSPGIYAGVQDIKIFRQRKQAFVYFTSRAQAEVSKMTLDGVMVHGVNIQVGWCDPVRVPFRHRKVGEQESRNEPEIQQHQVGEERDDMIHGAGEEFPPLPQPEEMQQKWDQHPLFSDASWDTQPPTHHFGSSQLFGGASRTSEGSWVVIDTTTGQVCGQAINGGHQYQPQNYSFYTIQNCHLVPVTINRIGEVWVGGMLMGTFACMIYNMEMGCPNLYYHPLPVIPVHFQVLTPIYTLPMDVSWTSFNNQMDPPAQQLDDDSIMMPTENSDNYSNNLAEVEKGDENLDLN